MLRPPQKLWELACQRRGHQPHHKFQAAAHRIGSERPQYYCISSLRAASTPAALSLIGKFSECSPASLQVIWPW